MNGKWLPWLLAAFAALAVLVITGDPVSPDYEVVAPTRMADTRPSIRALLSRRVGVNERGVDPFALPHGEAFSMSQQASSPPADPPQAGEQPSWNVIGKQYDSTAGWSVFLARDNQTCIVRVGDELDDGYRIVAINPPVLSLQHMKRKTRSTLDIGGVRE